MPIANSGTELSPTADPEIAAGSQIVYAVNELARRDLLQTWQRAPIPQYTQIEVVLGEVVHAYLRGEKPLAAALSDVQIAIERILKESARSRIASA